MADATNGNGNGKRGLPFGLDGKHLAAAAVAGSVGAGGGGYLGSSLVSYQITQLQTQISELQPITINQTKVMTSLESITKDIEADGKRLDRIDREQQKLIEDSKATSVNAARIEMLEKMIMGRDK
jgi:hypothetical protein